MTRNFTANGTFIPQDAAGNDMCILFMKYGRCRFRAKCKKSHWVPPLPGTYSLVIDLTGCTFTGWSLTHQLQVLPEECLCLMVENFSPVCATIHSFDDYITMAWAPCFQ